jgi:hypothetical protein
LKEISFLYPQFLWALTAVAIPLIVHLLNRKKRTNLNFSTTIFFVDSAKAKSKIRRIKNILLLLVRMAIIVCLILIFSAPYNPNDPFMYLADSNSNIFIYVDPTISMNYRDKGIPLWKKSFFLVDSLQKRRNCSERCFIYKESLNDFILFKNFVISKEGFTRHGPSDIKKMFLSYLEKIKIINKKNVLLIFSDFDEQTSKAVDTIINTNLDISFILVNVAPKNPWNLGIKNVSLYEREGWEIATNISCIGKKADSVKVVAETQGMRIGSVKVNLNSQETKTATLSVSSNIKSPQGFIGIEYDDPFLEDNKYFFVFGEKKIKKVLILGDAEECFPIVAAFSSLKKYNWLPFFVSASSVSYDNLDTADVIVLNGIKQLSSSILLFLKSKSYGNKAIIFSPLMDTNYYQVNLNYIPFDNKSSFFPVTEEKSHSIVLPDTTSFIFKGFKYLRDKDVAIYRYFQNNFGESIIKFDNGKSLASHFIDSCGNSWIIFSVPIGFVKKTKPDEIPLFETGIYVPLLDRLSNFALWAIKKETSAWIAGYYQKNPYSTIKGGALIFDEHNKIISQWSSQQFVCFDKVGNYKIQPEGKPSYWICVNIDTQETKFNYQKCNITTPRKMPAVFLSYKEFENLIKKNKYITFSDFLWLLLVLLLLAEPLLWERNTKGV